VPCAGTKARGTLLQWVTDDREGFAARYCRAREIGNAATGRPTVYTAMIADCILDELSDGRSLAAVCGDPGMPAPSMVRLWVAENREGFAPRYQLAREVGCYSLADQMLDIADDSSGDWIMRRKRDGTTKYVVNHQNIRRCRLRIKARSWLLSRMLPTIRGGRPELHARHETGGDLAALMEESESRNAELHRKSEAG
jgi:hypothetical protein